MRMRQISILTFNLNIINNYILDNLQQQEFLVKNIVLEIIDLQ